MQHHPQFMWHLEIELRALHCRQAFYKLNYILSPEYRFLRLSTDAGVAPNLRQIYVPWIFLYSSICFRLYF